MKTRMIVVAELVFDYNFYPRNQIDSAHVRSIKLAREAGIHLPPIVIDKATKRIVDGFHRVRDIQLEDKNGKIRCIEKTYANDAEMFLDAMRLNAGHGRNLTIYDRTHAILIAGKLGLDNSAIADALGMTMDRVGELRTMRTARSNGAKVAIKRTISHMAGKKLNQSQQEANRKLSGMTPSFYANQLLILVTNDLLDKEDEKLFETLQKLHEVLDELLAVT
jgi:hypothetical protein